MSDYAFHPEAFGDLDEIWEYIAEDNIDAADAVVADIHATLRALAASPHIGHRRRDLTKRPLRFHVVRDEYLVAHAPTSGPSGLLPWFMAGATRACSRRYCEAASREPADSST
jgi:antitoxin ParD1/3/4/toxin ParE1/3/4